MFSIQHPLNILTYWLIEPNQVSYFNNAVIIILCLLLTIPYHYQQWSIITTLLTGILIPPIVILCCYPHYRLAGGSGIVSAIVALTILITIKQHRLLNTILISWASYTTLLTNQPTISIVLHATSMIITLVLLIVIHYGIIITKTKHRKDNKYDC